MQSGVFLCCLWFMSTLPLPAQQPQVTLEEILHQHTQAFGSQDALEKIQTMKITGIYICEGYEYPIMILRKRPNLCRLEVQREGKIVICIYDGEKTWQTVNNNEQDIEDPLYYCTLLAFSNFDILPDYKSNGITIEYMGQEKFEDRTTYKLRPTFSDRKSEYWHIDSSTYQLLKVEGTTRWYEGGRAKKTILYMDYKAVEGIYFPHYVYCDITTFSTEVEIQDVEINPNLDPDLFRRTTR